MSNRIRSFLAAHHDKDSCWVWQGARDKDGYCRTKVDGTTRRAHRAVYEFSGREIPAGLSLLHTCDNPPCCNPHHLVPGTQKDNCQDAKAKDRHSRGTRNGIAKLNDDAVRAIRASIETQWTLADRYGVWQGTIWQIKHRKRWAHVQD